MKTRLQTILLSLALSAALVGCVDGSGSAVDLTDASTPIATDPATAWPEPVPPMPNDEVPPPPAFEPFDIALNQSVTVGAFLLELGAAHVTPQNEKWMGDAIVQIDFAAENLSAELHRPLDNVAHDGLLLETAGEFDYGQVMTEAVPGLRHGEGSIGWIVTFENGVTLNDIRNAVLTIGKADQNQVVVPFADPTTTTTLADVDLGQTFVIDGFRDADLEVTGTRVQYSHHSTNELFQAGTARLFMDAVLSGVEDTYSENWQTGNAFLERPDGVSVAPDDLNALVRIGERVEVLFAFELVQPIQGTYVFGVFDRDLGTRTVTIEVP